MSITSVLIGQKNGYYDNYQKALENCDSVKSFYDGGKIPKEIKKFKNLEEFIAIPNVKLKVLPKELLSLPKLKKLTLLCSDLNKNELCKLSQIDSLESIILFSVNKDLQLPSCMSRLENIKYAGLYSENFKKPNQVFDVICEWKNLEQLKIFKFGQLKVVPAKIKNLKKLTTLDMGTLNDDFDYSTTFRRMESLPIENLDLTGGTLTSFPAEIKYLKRLTTLTMSNMNSNFDYVTTFRRMEDLPIKNLSLSSNSLIDLPEGIKYLKELEYIDLSNRYSQTPPPGEEANKEYCGSEFQQIDEQIIELANLEKINFNGSCAIDGENTIKILSKHPKIREIDFSGCNIKNIPEEIRNFKSLEKIDFSNNPNLDLADLFVKLSAIETLKELNISFEDSKPLPKEIGLLENIETLNISGDSHGRGALFFSTNITLPKELYKLKNLKELNFYKVGLNTDELQELRKNLPQCKITYKPY